MARQINRKLVLEDGSEYYGSAFGEVCDKVCELVFNTSMVGYQEVVSDPSYTYQAVVMTYPLIGNYGVTDDDYETKTPTIGALIVGEYNDTPSNFRFTKTLGEILEENHIPGVDGIDTRKLTRSIRDYGSRRVLITSPDTPVESALEIIRSTPVPYDDIAQRFAQPRLRHIMLVLSDANRLGVDFDQLGKRVLQAAGDRNRAAQIGVVLRKFLCGKLARGIH